MTREQTIRIVLQRRVHEITIELDENGQCSSHHINPIKCTSLCLCCQNTKTTNSKKTLITEVSAHFSRD